MCLTTKRNKPKEANVVDDISEDVFDIDLIVVIFAVNLIGSNSKEWWIDTGVTRNVCSNKKMFSTFEPIETGELFHFRDQRPRKSGLEDDIWEGIDSNQCFICT